MSETQQNPGIVTGSAAPARTQDGTSDPVAKRTRWVGWVLFAGIMMILIGTFQGIAGLVAIFRDEYYLVTNSGLVITADYTRWGWTHLILGVLVALAGLAVMRGAFWARVVAVVLAGLSALANLLFLGAYPLWSLLVIAMDILVIFALVVHGSEITVKDS
jgi:hypothetical protein